MTELWYTVGPASLGREVELLAAGATGARLTFSFGDYDLQRERALTLRAAAQHTGLAFKVVADLPGGKRRLGGFLGDPSLRTTAGTVWQLRHTTIADPARDLVLPIPEQAFFRRLGIGNVIAIGDGAARLQITRVDSEANSAEAVVIDDCEIQHHRGLIIQGDDGDEPACLTDTDLSNLRRIVEDGVYDVVALSFVGSERDVVLAKEILGERGPKLIAKIETRGGLANVDGIGQVCDGLMAARGDLAMSLPWVELPAAVLRIASSARLGGVPWLLATQIADGSARDGFPTRAEICDLAHWRMQGCAGALLSYETAFGRDPVAAIARTRELLERWTPPEG